MGKEKDFVTAAEIAENTSKIEAPKVEAKVEPKAKTSKCRACCFATETEKVEDGKKKFNRCKGCGFMEKV